MHPMQNQQHYSPTPQPKIPKKRRRKSSMNTSCIPVIDIKDFPGQSEKLIAACEEWGCFRIINHKIPLSLMSEMKAVGESLLSLPMEIKRKTFDGVVGKGYIPPSEINPLYESLGVYDIALAEVFHSFCDRLNVSTHQRETILRYFKAVEELARYIGGKLVEALGLDIPEFMQGWPCQFRLLKYHFTPESVGSNGARMHSDLSYLTILQDDESVGGLELVDKQSGEIIDVEPSPPGTLLVVLGDIAKV
ncbi:unnamed protein product [Ilex paraguariensis]|uniref:Uncharacterized protein n=1 Tax=Ilex paraguariensis TaxID=185542 RepID=A0ABC8RT53_9AQUA